MIRIDAHHHFWHPARGDYDWMPIDNATLARPYGPADLAPDLTSAGIERTVLVQAAATVHETEYMLGLADAAPHVAAVVGWIDFEDQRDAETLARFAEHPKFVGVRPMIQDIPDNDWMLREDVHWAYRAVVEHDLTFDALGFPRHLSNFLALLKQHPDMRVVIDHCMKPQIGDHTDQSFHLWADGMTRIAQETAAFCKFSALVTEAKPDWSVADLRPYVDHIFQVFGPNRIMWGSDWPVCRLRCEYMDWHAAAQELTSGLSGADHARVYGGTAAAFYGIGD